MSRDAKKEYVVTGAYVTMTTQTQQGRQVRGFGPGSVVPAISEAEFDHLLSHGLIAARGEEPTFTVGPTPEAQAQQSRDEEAAARLQLAEAQARLDNARAQRESAEQGAKAEQAKADARSKRAEEAAQRVQEREQAAEPASPAAARARAASK